MIVNHLFSPSTAIPAISAGVLPFTSGGPVFVFERRSACRLSCWGFKSNHFYRLITERCWGNYLAATTKEGVKRSIRKKLESLASTSASIEQFSRSNIERAIRADHQLVDTALQELEQEGHLESRQIQLSVFLPRNKSGKEMLRNIASAGLLSYSSLAAAGCALAVLYVGLYFYPFPIEASNSVQTVTAAYLAGLLRGVFYSIFAAVLGGYALREGFAYFRKWQLLSEESYVLIADIAKYTILLSIAFLAIYYIANLFVMHSTTLELSTELWLIGFAFAITGTVKRISLKLGAGRRREASTSKRRLKWAVNFRWGPGLLFNK